MVNIGDTAPAFTLRATDKREVSLSEYAGKTVILAFYPGAFTGVCDKEMCAFQDNMATLNDAEAVVLGISVDSPCYCILAFGRVDRRDQKHNHG